MVQKQDISLMSADQLAAYVEAVRAKRRERSKKYYDNVNKNDPEKYKMLLDKYKKWNKTYYYSKDTNIIVEFVFIKNIYRI